MTQLANAADTTTQREIYFIDDGLTDVDTLLAALPDGAPWYLIDRKADGVQQMAEVLAEHAGLMAVHVLAHGTPGKMQLGNAHIDREALLRQVCLWEEIGAALDPDGDLLFYACELAGGRRGTDFIDTVYQLTGVNIAASRSLVGAAELGGNWELDARVGSVKSRPLDVQSYAGVLAAPTVIEPLTLDSGFDQPLDAADPGTVTTAFAGFDSAATAVTIDSAGKLIVAGWRYVGDPANQIQTFYVVRYNADGSLDTSFSGDGMATASFGSVGAAANAVGIDSAGRIVAVGYAGDAFAIARFNADGAPDTTFGGGDGELTGAFGAAFFSMATGVAFAGTDIVIAGSADGDFGIARIDETGTLTQSVTTDIAGGSADSVAAIAVLADNTILVAGSADDGVDANFVLANYNVADLSATTGLGGTGIANIDFGGGVDLASAMAIDASGRAVLAGTRTNVDFSRDFVVARYNTDGSLDTSFGGSGWVVTDFAGGDDEAFAVVVQADGKIVVSGRTSVGGGQYDTVFARYNPDGSLDTEFDGDGRLTVAVDVGVGQGDDSAAAMAIASNGEIVAAGSALNTDSGQTGVALINLAPVVPTLGTVAEDTAAPAGASVSSLVAANFSDPDLGDALGGVAIAGDASNAGQGVWEYSSDNGVTWFAVGPVDATNALLVAASDLLRFVPAADSNGTPGALTLHLVDTLSGVSFSAGATRQMLLNGSATAGVSVDTLTLSTSVSAVADAPTLTAASLADVVEGTASPSGETVAALFGAGFADADAGDTLAGIAIAGDASTAAQGLWEYSVDGLAWTAVGPVSAGAALLLDASAQLRFVPTADFQGVPGALAVHAVDSSAALSFTIDPGLPQTFDTANDAETSGVAVASVGLSVTVTNLSDAPTILYSMLPDPAFGNGGLATAEFGTAIDEIAVGVALQAGGQVVVAGSTFDGVATQFAVARYDAGGVLDGSFGTGGKLTTQFVEGDATAEAVTVAPLSNKILVAGSVTDGFQADFAVARYDAATGALDTTFGGDGTVTTAIGAGDDVATSMSIDGGGQVVLAGYTFNGIDNDIAVARYNFDGSLDTSFSGDGIATLDFGGGFDEANAVQALGDGKIIVAGSSDGVFAVARFNEDGTLDTTFDADGALTTDVGGFGFSIATTILEQADGKILVGGYASGADFFLDFALVRYNADGSLDLGFGDSGVVLTDFGHGDDFGASVIIDADGKIVLSGTAANADFSEDMAFARYNSDGSLDASFGTGGLLQLAIGSGAAAAIASTLTLGGDVLAVGTAANVDGTADFAVVQLSASTSVALASIDEDSAFVIGDSVLNLFGNSFHDVDGDTFAGVAVSADTATPDQGVWEYSTDAGTSWFAVGGVSAGAALLLAADSLLRFLPATDYHGTPGGLEAHLVDSSTTAAFTNGALTQVFDTAAAGAGSAVSANSIGLVTTVMSINDAPIGSDGTVTVVEDTARVLTAADFGFADIDVGDVLASVEITDISVLGTLTLGGFTVFPFDIIARADIDAGLLVFQPLTDGSGAAYASISFMVNDGTDSALVPNTLTFDVTAVNDAPVLTVDTAGAVIEDATAPSLTDSGVLSFSDADAGDLVTVGSAYNGDAVWSGGTLSLAEVTALTAGFSNDQVNWNYSVANADLQFLGAGETVTFSVTVTATDDSGTGNNSASQVVTMTLTGANDAPALNVEVAGAVSEDAAVPTLTDSGVLSFSDVDAGDLVTVSSAYNSDATWSGGALSLAQVTALTGGFSNDQDSWDYSVANADLQFLGAGETVTFSVTVTATDDSGAANNSSSQVVTMTLTGANDVPVLTVDVAGAVSEDAAVPTLTDSGALSFSDADVADLVTVSSAYNSDAAWSGGALSLAQVTALTGGFSNDQDSWDYSVANAALQFLGAGETVTFSVTVTATDDSGAANNSASQVVTMTLTGANDVPLLTVDVAGAVTEDAVALTLTDSGVLSFSDADAGDVVTVSNAYNSDAVWSGGTLSAAQATALTAGFSNDQNSWDYSVANADLQFLGAGETVTFSVTVTATDDSGAGNNSASQVVTMTLTGANDTPVLTVDVAGAVTEDAAAPTLTDSGLLNFSDADATDLVKVSSTYNGDISWSAGALSDGQIASLTAGFSNDQNSWDYSVANAHLVFLSPGETITFSYTVTATDDSGAVNNSASQVVTITLFASSLNTAPVLTVDVAGAVSEDAAVPALTDSGVLSFSDADATDLVTVSSAYNGDAIWSGGTLGAAQVTALTGGFSNDQDSWDYSVSNADLQFLGAGETVTFSVTVTATDDSGAANNSASQVVTMTLTGANDAPVLTVDVAGAVTEDAAAPTLTDSGVLSFSDADVADLVTVSSAYNGDAVWSGGALSAAQVTALTAGFGNDQTSWNYSVANADLQFLGAGETVTFSVTVTATDDSGTGNNSASQVVTMTLTGANDAPVLTVDVAGGVTEDAASPTLTDSGVLSFSDADVADLVTVSSAYNSDAVWSGGTLSLAQIAALTAGFSNDQDSWDYSVANADLQFLGAGETVTFSVTVAATDDSGTGNNSASQVVTMTLTGANDAPVLSVDLAGAVTEDVASPTLTDSGVLSFSDADAGEVVTVSSAYNGDAVWSGGSLSTVQLTALTSGFSNDQNSWDYSVANLALQFLGAGETVSFSYTVTATDNSGATNNSASQVVTMTLTGANDAPVLTSATAVLGTGTEGQAYTVSLSQLLAGWTDPDGDPLTIANLVADHGTVTDNQDGTFTVVPAAYYYGLMTMSYDVVDGRGGVVATSLDYTLADVRSDMYVPGTGGNDSLWGDQIDAGSWDTLDGGDGDDALLGLAGNDTLSGGTGNDWINGGTGADVMSGGEGNDTFVVDDVLDSILEGAGQGIDTVRTSLSSYTLGDEIENLVFVGAGDYAGTGNAVANVLYGAAGNDTLAGLGGDDSLMGMGGNDTLDGGDGDDWLNGGEGVDTMVGGAGNDVYVVDDVLDSVIEAAGQGIDTVMTTTAGLTLGAEVENLVFTGAGSFTGTGNGLANVLYGGADGDTLVGLGGADSLMGMGGNDTLDGGDGDDWLNGGAGADLMVGGAGNDNYIVDDVLDVVAEVAGQGVDTVRTGLSSHNLGAEVENLVFTGAGSFAGTGNGLANVIYGGAGSDLLIGLGGDDSLLGMDGDDTLVGGAGNDWLTGGAGNDVFVFSAIGFGRDRVVDFGDGQDLLDISGLGISAASFASAVTIQDLGTDVLLSFAGGDSIHLAGIADATTITASDFILAA